MSNPNASGSADEKIDELRDVWLSRLMFGWLVDAKHGNAEPVFTETRSFEQFCADHDAALGGAV